MIGIGHCPRRDRTDHDLHEGLKAQENLGHGGWDWEGEGYGVGRAGQNI